MPRFTRALWHVAFLGAIFGALCNVAGCRGRMTERSRAEVCLGVYVHQGKTDQVEAILKVYPDLVNARDEELGRTPIYDAVSFNQQGVVDVLIKHGANVNVQDSFGDTPLMSATLKSEAIVRLLIRAGARLNSLNKHGETALHWAIQDANLAMVKLLVKAGADVNACKKNADTPLSLARKLASQTSLRVKSPTGDIIRLNLKSPEQMEPQLPIIAYLKKHGAR